MARCSPQDVRRISAAIAASGTNRPATAALLLALRPDLTQDAVYALLAAGASDQIGLPEDDTPGWDMKYGYGRISAGASLRILKRMLGSSGMHSAPATITAEKGGRQLLVAQVGRAAAGSSYLVLGSVSGTVPGTILNGVTVPLVADRYFVQTMLGVGGLIDSSGGLVPTDGTILSVVSVPPNWHSAAELPGIAHAVLVPRPKFAEPFSSEPAILQVQD